MPLVKKKKKSGQYQYQGYAPAKGGMEAEWIHGIVYGKTFTLKNKQISLWSYGSSALSCPLAAQ